MAQEEVTILRIDTGEAVRNINDLKENIKRYKEALSELQIGSEDYKNVLTALETNQAALKNAMHGTATTMEQIAAAAHGTDESYNGLVRRMAILKEELRATDISAEGGAQKFATLAGQINETNEKLKLLDKMQGNYQRNVGNYKSALDGLAAGFKATAGSAGAVIQPLANMNMGLKAISTTPAIAVLGLLANVLSKVATGIKSSEENTNAWNRALAAFKPISDAFMRSMQEVGRVAADLANKFADLLIEWGFLDEEAARHRQNMETSNQELRELRRQTLISNSQLNAELQELRDKAAEKEKYTAEQRLKFLEEAQDRQRKITKNNIQLAEAELFNAEAEARILENDAEANDKLADAKAHLNDVRAAGSAANRALEQQINRVKRETNATRESAATEEEAAKTKLATWDDLVRAMQAREQLMSEARQMEAENAAEMDAYIAAADAELTENIQNELDDQLNAEFEAQQRERELMQRRIAVFTMFAGTLADITASIADIYEADGEADEKAAKKAKALKTASAIISTLGGAVSAYTSTWAAAEIPVSAKMVLAPLNAAAVLAAGLAQVKQINAVKVGDGGGASVAVPAPVFSPVIAQTRSITGASEEDRLNRMASDSRVILVYSDIEAAQHAQRVRVRETEF